MELRILGLNLIEKIDFRAFFDILIIFLRKVYGMLETFDGNSKLSL